MAVANRTERVTLRLTLEEKKILNDLADGENQRVSDFLRKIINDYKKTKEEVKC